MPQLLTPEQFTMDIADGAPTITVQGVTVSTTDGWSILNRATLIVVDGPARRAFSCLETRVQTAIWHRRAGMPPWHQSGRCEFSSQELELLQPSWSSTTEAC